MDFLFQNKTFTIASVILLVYATISTIFLESFYISYDIWDHVAQITAFKDNIFSPVDPYLRGGNFSHLLTPYHQILGSISKLLGLTPYTIFSIAGIFNLAFFIFSVRDVSQYVFGDIKYSLIILIVLLGFWYYPPVSSGVYDFSLIPLTLGYPYRAVLPVLLIVFAKINCNLNVKSYVLYTILCTFIITTHPLSGAFLMLLIGSKALMFEGWNNKKIKLLLLPVISLLLAFLWPYYPIFKLINSATELNVFNLPDAYQIYYKTFYTVTILLIPSLIVVIDKIKSRDYDYRIALITLLAPILLLNYIFFHNEPIARFVILLTFVLHLLTIEWLITKWLPKGSKQQLSFVVFSCVLFILQLQFSFTTVSIFPDIQRNKPLGHHSNFRYYNEYLKLDDWIKDGGIILAPIEVSLMISRITHQNVVAYYRKNLAIKGTNEKSADVINYFSTSSVHNKNSIIAKYHVKYLVSKENDSALKKQGLNLKYLGSIDDYPVYRIDGLNEQ